MLGFYLGQIQISFHWPGGNSLLLRGLQCSYNIVNWFCDQLGMGVDREGKSPSWRKPLMEAWTLCHWSTAQEIVTWVWEPFFTPHLETSFLWYPKDQTCWEHLWDGSRCWCAQWVPQKMSKRVELRCGSHGECDDNWTAESCRASPLRPWERERARNSTSWAMVTCGRGNLNQKSAEFSKPSSWTYVKTEGHIPCPEQHKACCSVLYSWCLSSLQKGHSKCFYKAWYNFFFSPDLLHVRVT